MTKRIDVLMLISGLSEEVLDLRRESLYRYASEGTEVRLVMTDFSPPSVESFAEMELAAPGILKRVVRSEREGADAVVIWGGHDPSLFAAREMVSIPVIGPGMASMIIASTLAEKFTLLIQLPQVIGIARRQIRDLGLLNRCAGIFPVGLPVLELGKRDNFDKVRQTTVDAIEKSGADAVCFGCMALDDHAEPLSQALEKSHPGIVVMHPGKAAIRFAELVIDLGISHSKRSYPKPVKDVTFPF